MLVCICRAGHAVRSEIRTADCALLGRPSADAISCAGNAPGLMQRVCASACTFVQAKGVEEGGFSMRACEEEDGSRREGFSRSQGLVDVPGAPDAPSWPIHKSAGGQG